MGHAAEPRLTLIHTGAEAAVSLSGEEGVEYLLEAASDSAQKWNVLSSFLLNEGNRVWRQGGAESGARFFRARTVVESDDRFAKNFGLIDHTGMMRELHYFRTLRTLKAVVLIFAEGNYASFAAKISPLLTNAAFQNKVFFWTIETQPENSRTNITREAAEAGIQWPVLHDPLGLTKRDFGARFHGETFVIRPADMKIVYRGLIDDAIGDGPATQEFLAKALTNVVAFEPVVTSRVEPSRNLLGEVRREVADYAAVIAPLLRNKCITCHSPDNIAPFALTNHQSVVEHAAGMRAEVMTGHMPPWHADPLYGTFKNDISLSRAERATLVDWLDAGAPRSGEDDPLTNLPPSPTKWPRELGAPDQVVSLPLQAIPAAGAVAYRHIVAKATNEAAHWLRAAVVRPSNRRVVHHYNVWEGRVATALVLAAYSPGRNESGYPEGVGWLLREKMEMTFEIHYHASGQEETDQPEIAFWYASGPPDRALRGIGIQNPNFAVPPGHRDFQVVASHQFANPIRLYFVNPHMHIRGSRMRFELTVPGQPKRIIASIPKYSFHWQTVYHFDVPLDLPANSVIDVIGAFDNSTLNRENPDPDAIVRWGSQSWDEMFIGYMEYSDL